MKECCFCAPISSEHWSYIQMGDPGGINVEIGIDGDSLCCWFYYGKVDLNAMREIGISFCPLCGRRLRDA